MPMQSARTCGENCVSHSDSRPFAFAAARIADPLSILTGLGLGACRRGPIALRSQLLPGIGSTALIASVENPLHVFTESAH